MIFTDRFMAVPFVIMFHVCLYYTVLSFHCSLASTCWEMADLLAILRVIFPCVFVSLPYGISLDVSIPDLYYLLNFSNLKLKLTTFQPLHSK